MHGTASATATVAIAASCLAASADAFHTSPSFAPSLATRASAHTALPLRTSRPICAAVTMSAASDAASKRPSLRAAISRIAKGTVAGAALALAVLAPKAASASAAGLAEPPVDLEAPLDEPVTLYQATTIKKAVTLQTFGVAGAAAAGVLGGASVVAVKRESKRVVEEIDAFEGEVERMEQFKQEFLDGVSSDRSLFASLNKAVKQKLPEQSEGAVSEDEFERNVQAFLDEENDKAEAAKKKPEYRVEKGGPTLLERPDDVDGAKADEWLEDIGFEDTPAAIDAEQLARLQRMFGGGGDAAPTKE